MRALSARINGLLRVTGIFFICFVMWGCGGVKMSNLNQRKESISPTEIIETTHEEPQNQDDLMVTETEIPNDSTQLEKTPVKKIMTEIPNAIPDNEFPLFSIEKTPGPITTAERIIQEIMPVYIVKPGEGSEALSPLIVSIAGIEIGDKPITIELRGSDGRLIVRKLLIPDKVDERTIQVILSFEIEPLNENARLLISTKDMFNRLMHVHSVELVLLREGNNLIHEEPQNPVISIHEPSQSDIIKDGELIIRGDLCSNSDEPLRVLLVGEDGRTVGQRLAAVNIEDSSDCGTFSSTVSYLVTEKTRVRLIVYQDGNPVSEIRHLTSIPIQLNP